MKSALEAASRCVGSQVFAAELLADARALWAVRVLDAWAKVHSRPAYWKTRVRFDGENECALFYTNGAKFVYRLGPTPDAAREAAALAVWPELPADARQALGEQP
jgi:hypothetical protein